MNKLVIKLQIKTLLADLVSITVYPHNEEGLYIT